jgi:hypothetical protein
VLVRERDRIPIPVCCEGEASLVGHLLDRMESNDLVGWGDMDAAPGDKLVALDL